LTNDLREIDNEPSTINGDGFQMKRLYVLRHAKSSWDDAGLSDFDRPLNKRGLETAPFMGRTMLEKDYIPDIVVASPAARAASTANLAAKAASFSKSLSFDERIYEASPHTLVEIITVIDDLRSSAMLVGHNPGMEGVVNFLTGRVEPMPTASLAVLELDIDRWQDIDAGSARKAEILRPKEQMGR